MSKNSKNMLCRRNCTVPPSGGWTIGIVKKCTVNLHDCDRLSYIQAEELSLATVYRSQQLYTAEQWLNCKKEEVEERYPPPFSSVSSFSPVPSPCREATS